MCGTPCQTQEQLRSIAKSDLGYLLQLLDGAILEAKRLRLDELFIDLAYMRADIAEFARPAANLQTTFETDDCIPCRPAKQQIH